jgi:malonyl-CoA/methylmalonyl-CoA synthetase
VAERQWPAGYDALVAAPRWPHLALGPPFSSAGPLSGDTLPALWSTRWAAEPSVPLLFDETSAAERVGLDGWCVAGAFDDRTRAEAGRLAAAGLSAGDRLLWCAGPSLDSLVTCIAALRLGAVVVPANPAYTARELVHIVGDVRPQLAAVERSEQAAWVESASAGATPVIGLAADGPARAPGPSPALDQVGPGDPALIVYTSGTTGAPKGAVLSHGNLLAGVRAVCEAWQWDEKDRLVLALPLFHVHGLCAGLFGTLAAGASAVLVRFDAAGVLDAADRHAGTLFFGVPTMYRRLLESGRAFELANLRLCVSGSAPLPAELFGELSTQARIEPLERYGMTETLLTLSNPLDGERRPGTVGFPLPGVQARVEEDGALWVRGPSVFGGYWERPVANAECMVEDWFRTGDIVSIDDDGYFRVQGRSGDVIISGGFNVYPAEVEDVLMAHARVFEVAVVGTPSPEWGEAVTAWVVPDGSLDVGELLTFAAARLAPYKRPRSVRLIDVLPRNAMGKVLRSELR